MAQFQNGFGFIKIVWCCGGYAARSLAKEKPVCHLSFRPNRDQNAWQLICVLDLCRFQLCFGDVDQAER
jgi:hypothetical protein